MPTVASSFAHPVCVLSMVPKSVEVSLSAVVRRTRCCQEALKASATLGDCDVKASILVLLFFSHLLSDGEDKQQQLDL